MNFKAIIGIWCLSYLDKEAVDKFIEWAIMNSNFIIFIEPIHNYHSYKEYFLDNDQ